MKHVRLYTNTGGIVRFTYDMPELLNTVQKETQFVGRNIPDTQGNVDLNKMAGPDDLDFVVRSIKSSSDMLDAFLPKHVKPDEYGVIAFSDDEITLTFNNSGKTAFTVLEQAYEHVRGWLTNTMIRVWFEKVNETNRAETFAAIANTSLKALQRVLMHSFMIGQAYGSRFPKVNPDDAGRALKGKFLGTYRTEDGRDAVHGTFAAGDISYVEAEKDYMVYTSEWAALKTVIAGLSAGDKKDATGNIDFPTAVAGDVFYITKGGTIGDYNDKVYAGEAVVCVRDNDMATTGENNLTNFIVIGPAMTDHNH